MKRILIMAMLVASFTACKCSETNSDSTENATLETIFARKSVRSFTEQVVETEKVELLLKAGISAPSGMDMRPWELIVVNEREMLDKLAAVLPYAKMLQEAPLAIIVCGDTASPLWQHDCSAVTQNILLAAESLGLGAVWTSAIDQARSASIRSIIAIPDNIGTLCVIPIGYPKGEHKPKDKWNPAKIHYNGW